MRRVLSLQRFDPTATDPVDGCDSKISCPSNQSCDSTWSTLHVG